MNATTPRRIAAYGLALALVAVAMPLSAPSAQAASCPTQNVINKGATLLAPAPASAVDRTATEWEWILAEGILAETDDGDDGDDPNAILQHVEVYIHDIGCATWTSSTSTIDVDAQPPTGLTSSLNNFQLSVRFYDDDKFLTSAGCGDSKVVGDLNQDLLGVCIPTDARFIAVSAPVCTPLAAGGSCLSLALKLTK